jgi:hypothetical protein
MIAPTPLKMATHANHKKYTVLRQDISIIHPKGFGKKNRSMSMGFSMKARTVSG